MQTPNASLHLLPEAAAQRTLEAVSCKALLGGAIEVDLFAQFWGRTRLREFYRSKKLRNNLPWKRS